MPGKPQLSIITVVFNAEKLLPDTLKSIREQQFATMELIIVDGGSNDGTLDIVKSNSDLVTRWVSEKDKGIYDAMNKGIAMAAGEWLYFLNAGDDFFSPTTLKQVFNGQEKEVDLLYGRIKTKNEPTGVDYEFGSELSVKNFYHDIPISHQGVFFRRELFERIGKYNLEYRLLADQEWLVRFFNQPGYSAQYLNQIIARYETVGFSYVNRLKSLKEVIRYGRAHFPFYVSLLNYMFYPLMVIKVKLIVLLRDTKFFRAYRKWRFS